MKLGRTVLEPIRIANIDVDRTIVPQIVDLLIDGTLAALDSTILLRSMDIVDPSRIQEPREDHFVAARVHHVFRWQLWNLT